MNIQANHHMHEKRSQVHAPFFLKSVCLLFWAAGLFIIFCQTALAQGAPASCIQQEPHTAVTFLLIDRSDKLENTEGLKQTLLAAKQMTKPAERVVIGVSTGKASDARILVDLVRPEKTLWESMIKIRAKEKVFNDCFQETEKKLIEQGETHKTSALLETLSFVSNVLSADQSAEKKVIVYSDMVQNTESLSFFTLKTIDPEATLKKLNKDNMVWQFAGVKFYIAGVGMNVSDQKGRAIEAFWRKYLEQSGGVVSFYGPILLAS